MTAIVTTDDVLHAMQLGESERLEVDSVVRAVNSLIKSYKGERDTWPEYWAHGAKMLAMRIYRRRDSPRRCGSTGRVRPGLCIA